MDARSAELHGHGALVIGHRSHPMKGPLLGANPAIGREEAKVDKMIASICRVC